MAKTSIFEMVNIASTSNVVVDNVGIVIEAAED